MPGEILKDDRVESVGDLFRFLRRAREYLVEADRQLRDGGTKEEQAASAAWYEDMDAADDWTGYTAEAHVACTQDIILYFDEHPEIVAKFDNKNFLIDNAWQKLNIAEQLAELRKDAAALLVRIARESTKQ